MFNLQTSYLSPKLEARLGPEKGGYGVYAKEGVETGELLAVWGGEVVTGEQLIHLPATMRRYSLQVEEDMYLVTTGEPVPADYINHCCNPNAGLQGQITLVAMRDIAPGEEVCFDYAMSDGSPYDEFECSCGALNCREWITGHDWARPDLWARYDGYFSPYLQRRIERLKANLFPRNGSAKRLMQAGLLDAVEVKPDHSGNGSNGKQTYEDKKSNDPSDQASGTIA